MIWTIKNLRLLIKELEGNYPEALKSEAKFILDRYDDIVPLNDTSYDLYLDWDAVELGDRFYLGHPIGT